MRRQVEHTGRMQSRLGGQAEAVAEVVVAVQAIEKQREALDDEVAVVADARAHVPRIFLVEEVAFHAESDVHRLEGRVHAAVLAQRNGCRVAVGQAKLEVEMAVAPTQVEQGVEFLQVVAWEQEIEIAVLQIQSAAFRLEQIHLVLQVEGITAQSSRLKTKADVEVVGELLAAFQGE